MNTRKKVLTILTALLVSSCGGGNGGSGSSASSPQGTSDYDSRFLFGSPTGGVVRFYASGQLLATYSYDSANIVNSKSTASVYPTVFAAGAHRNFVTPFIVEETVTRGKHTLRVVNQDLCVDNLDTFRDQENPRDPNNHDETRGTSDLVGGGDDKTVTVAFPKVGTVMTFEGNPEGNQINIDEGRSLLYLYLYEDNGMEEWITSVSVDPK